MSCSSALSVGRSSSCIGAPTDQWSCEGADPDGQRSAHGQFPESIHRPICFGTVKSRYFFRGRGGLDLIGSLPLMRIFQLFRVLRVICLLRRYRPRNVLWRSRCRPCSGRGSSLPSLRSAVSSSDASRRLGLKKAPGANILTRHEALLRGKVRSRPSATAMLPGHQSRPSGRGTTMLIGSDSLGTFTGYLANAFIGPPATSQPERPR